MKKAIGVGLSTLLILVLGAVAALASHTVALSFSANPVEAGTAVTVTAQTDRSEGNVHIEICEAVNEFGTRTGVYVASSVCADSTAAEWYRFVAADGLTRPSDLSAEYSFDTTGLGGSTVGFRAIHPPTNHSEGHPIDTKDLVITAPTVDDVHAGCQGIEKAMQRVGNNGKAKTALTKVYEDNLNCG